jgi:hypothetical protein
MVPRVESPLAFLLQFGQRSEVLVVSGQIGVATAFSLAILACCLAPLPTQTASP